jgi:hypothetical protein
MVNRMALRIPRSLLLRESASHPVFPKTARSLLLWIGSLGLCITQGEDIPKDI